MLKFIGQLIWFSIEMLEFRIFVAYSVVLQIFVYTFVAKVGSPAARSEEENQSDEDSCLTTTQFEERITADNMPKGEDNFHPYILEKLENEEISAADI
jgi:hypothetical protein